METTVSDITLIIHLYFSFHFWTLSSDSTLNERHLKGGKQHPALSRFIKLFVKTGLFSV